MRLLAGLAFLAAIAGGGAAAEPLDLKVEPIERFSLAGPEASLAPLEFLGGVRMSSDGQYFGGLSGIQVLDGDTALMLGDSGTYVRARLVHEGGRLVGVADAEIGSIMPDGGLSKVLADVEDLAVDPADPTRGVIVRERQANALLDFRMRNGHPSDFAPRTVGADNRLLRSNKGLESVAYAPEASPAAGGIVAVAESPPSGEEDIPGWIAGVGPFAIVRHDGFDVSSARFLPNGDLILLERRVTLGFGIAVRLRRIGGEALAVGARLDGDYILDVGITSQIDNMEGLAVHVDGFGRTILTLVSDDNHSILQRTLILQFALAED